MKTFDRLLALRATPSFRSLSASALRALAHLAEERHMGAGEAVAPCGATFGQLAVVVRGAVHTSEGRPVGPVLGLSSLLFQRRLRVDLLAHEEHGCTVLLLGRSVVFSLVQDYPDVICSVLGHAEETRMYAAEQEVG